MRIKHHVESIATLSGLGLLLLFWAFPGAAALPQGKLPDGPGRDTTQRVCGQCHGAEVVLGQGHTREEWGEKVSEMVTFGATGTDEEFNVVVDYLSKNFPPKVNVNKASSKDLQTGLDFSAKEAEALIQYRERNGNYKSLDDLKKVPGLDSKKLDAIKERLSF